MMLLKLRGLAALTAVAWLSLCLPAQTRNAFHFSILGDRTGSAVPGVYERVWREVGLMHPDFVINVGDTIEGGNDGAAAEEWEAVRRVWSKYAQLPLYLAPGNHDIWSPASERLWVKVTGHERHYSFNYQDAHFTVLDNSRTDALPDSELTFLERDLAANHERDPKFVFFHRPFWILPLKFGSGDFALHRLARQYGVRYVLCGHGHQFVKLERDGVTYIEVGSSGGHIDRGLNSGQGFAQGWFFGHVWATVQGGRVEFTVRELDGARGKGRLFSAGEWTDKGPAFDPEDPGSLATP